MDNECYPSTQVVHFAPFQRVLRQSMLQDGLEPVRRTRGHRVSGLRRLSDSVLLVDRADVHPPRGVASSSPLYARSIQSPTASRCFRGPQAAVITQTDVGPSVPTLLATRSAAVKLPIVSIGVDAATLKP